MIGGGTGGCAVASKFARIIPKQQIAIVEPQTVKLNMRILIFVFRRIIFISPD